MYLYCINAWFLCLYSINKWSYWCSSNSSIMLNLISFSHNLACKRTHRFYEWCTSLRREAQPQEQRSGWPLDTVMALMALPPLWTYLESKHHVRSYALQFLNCKNAIFEHNRPCTCWLQLH
jgi:hypothetical protein